MAFEETEVGTIKGPRPDVSASISGARVGALRLTLSFSPAGAEKFKVAEGERFKVLIGTGEDAGRLRLQRTPSGNCQIIRIGRGDGSLVINCGRHPSFTAPRSREPATVVVGKDKAIDVTLPDPWPRNEFSRQGGGRKGKSEPARSGSAEASPVTTPTEVVSNGIRIDLGKGDERVTFEGKSSALTAQEAIVVHDLARDFGKTVGAAALVGRLWVGRTPRQAAGDLEALVAAVNLKLRAVGLTAFNSGFGWILMRSKAKTEHTRGAA